MHPTFLFYFIKAKTIYLAMECTVWQAKLDKSISRSVGSSRELHTIYEKYIYTIIELTVSDSRELLLTVEKCSQFSRISLLCTIVQKNVYDRRDFCLYLWSAVNVRKTLEYCRNLPFVVMCGTLWQAKLISHNNDAIMATDVDELVAGAKLAPFGWGGGERVHCSAIM